MTSTLAAMLVLLALLSPADARLARQVQGEAGICGLGARIAAAYVCQRSTCYGDAEPDALTVWVILYLDSLQDTSKGATFLLSDADMKLASVQAMVGEHIVTWECDHDYRLHAYTEKETK